MCRRGAWPPSPRSAAQAESGRLSLTEEAEEEEDEAAEEGRRGAAAATTAADQEEEEEEEGGGGGGDHGGDGEVVDVGPLSLRRRKPFGAVKGGPGRRGWEPEGGAWRAQALWREPFGADRGRKEEETPDLEEKRWSDGKGRKGVSAQPVAARANPYQSEPADELRLESPRPDASLPRRKAFSCHPALPSVAPDLFPPTSPTRTRVSASPSPTRARSRGRRRGRGRDSPPLQPLGDRSGARLRRASRRTRRRRLRRKTPRPSHEAAEARRRPSALARARRRGVACGARWPGGAPSPTTLERPAGNLHSEWDAGLRPSSRTSGPVFADYPSRLPKTQVPSSGTQSRRESPLRTCLAPRGEPRPLLSPRTLTFKSLYSRNPCCDLVE